MTTYPPLDATNPVAPGPEAPDVTRTPPRSPAFGRPASRALRARPGDPWWARPAVALIAVLAGVAYGWGVTHDGFEAYYAAAVRSMATSWHVFFFDGFDPGGTITLDKLPGAFWIQALSVRAFGMSTPSLIMPQVIMGALAVLALYRAVNRVAGPRTGLVAALLLATSPAAVVLSRGNTADPVCVLLLILAADAALKAAANGRVRTLLLSALYVGLAFQAKMIEAWMVLPALGIAYLVAAPGTLRRRVGRLSIAGAVVVAVSLSWMIAVTLVPASNRPYVDGSRHNSEFAQVFEYNGVDRFTGTAGYGLGRGLPYTPSPQARAYDIENREGFVPGADSSTSGATRLISGPIGRDAGWLLPAALLALLAGLIRLRRRPRTDAQRAALLLWGTWLVTFTVAFCAATTLLSYYTGLLAPAVAALCAIGCKLAYRRRATVLVAAVAGSALLAVALTRATTGWLPVAVGTLGVLALCLLIVSFTVAPATRRAGAVACLAAVILGPAVSSIWLVNGGAGSFDAPYVAGGTLAQQYAVPSPDRMPGYGGTVQPFSSALTWDRLAALRATMSPLGGEGSKLVFFTSAEASDYVLAGVAGVVPVGGFTGLVDAPTLDQLRQLLATGDVRWALVPGPGDLRANDPRVLLIESECTLFDGASRTVTAAPQVYDCLHTSSG